VIATVTRFASVFAEVARRTAVTPRLLVSAETADPWTDARHSHRGLTSSELNQLAASEMGIGVVRDADHLVLLVTTPDGVYERRTPDATPLRPRIPPGIAAERATREAAATWGLPDFVMPPMLERKGRRRRTTRSRPSTARSPPSYCFAATGSSCSASFDRPER
jgi:hypothetical protein